jgi:hypothetical protein
VRIDTPQEVRYHQHGGNSWRRGETHRRWPPLLGGAHVCNRSGTDHLDGPAPPPPTPRLSRLAVAAFLCGAAAPVVGIAAVDDAGSDLSDLLTLTFPLFLCAAVGLCILVHRAARKAPQRLRGKGFANAGALLAAVTVCAGCLLIPAG